MAAASAAALAAAAAAATLAALAAAAATAAVVAVDGGDGEVVGVGETDGDILTESCWYECTDSDLNSGSGEGLG